MKLQVHLLIYWKSFQNTFIPETLLGPELSRWVDISILQWFRPKSWKGATIWEQPFYQQFLCIQWIQLTKMQKKKKKSTVNNIYIGKPKTDKTKTSNGFLQIEIYDTKQNLMVFIRTRKGSSLHQTKRSQVKQFGRF